MEARVTSVKTTSDGFSGETGLYVGQQYFSFQVESVGIFEKPLEPGDKIEIIVIPKPPKKYSFAEAYQMMRQGKWMLPENSTVPYRWSQCYACWQIKNKDNTATQISSLPFLCIESQWEEVA